MKRATKLKSEAKRRLLDRWYRSYDHLGYEGPLFIFGVPLSKINTRGVTDLWIANIKESGEINDAFDEEIREEIAWAEELYNDTIDD